MPASGNREVRTEILTIGREILDGRVVDTNAVVLAEALKAVGLTPRYAQKVDDDLDRIVEAFQIAAGRASVVLVTGGLGPTSDDLTAQAFAKFLGEPLVLDERALAQIEAYFKRAGRELLEVQKKQAFFPRSCFWMENPEGTAPGFGLVRPEGAWFFMPGVPREMKRMIYDQVVPRLREAGLTPSGEAKSVTWATQFTSEGELQQRLSPIEKRLPEGFEVTYRTRFPENHIGLHAICATPEEQAAFTALSAEITAVLGADVFASCEGLEKLKDLEAVVVDLLKSRGTWLTTVESCTGGLVANRITNVSGSSSVFWGSSVTYDNSAKELLGVDPKLLEKHGAVSPEVARELARLGLERLASRKPNVPAICVATTGIAGPTGGTEAKPVGLCFVGLARTGAEVETFEIRGRRVWNRSYMKAFFAQKALEAVRRALLQ